jgi:hypothetical protein
MEYPTLIPMQLNSSVQSQPRQVQKVEFTQIPMQRIISSGSESVTDPKQPIFIIQAPYSAETYEILNLVTLIVNIVFMVWTLFILVCNAGTFFYMIKYFGNWKVIVFFVLEVLWFLIKIYQIVYAWINYFKIKAQTPTATLIYWINIGLSAIGLATFVCELIFSIPNLSFGVNFAFVLDFLLYAALVVIISLNKLQFKQPPDPSVRLVAYALPTWKQ